jgi:hypothetical protein
MVRRRTPAELRVLAQSMRENAARSRERGFREEAERASSAGRPSMTNTPRKGTRPASWAHAPGDALEIKKAMEAATAEGAA